MSARAAATEADVVARLQRARVLPVATVEDPDRVEDVCNALVSGGVDCIEIAFRSDAASEALRRAARVEGCLVGAGTLLSVGQVETAVEAGAQFGVAPGTSPQVVAACRELELPFFPGVATPTEIERARHEGCRVLKVFPADQVGGPGFLRAVTATYPDVRFLPTGGVGPDNLRDYLAVRSVLAVGGSWLVAPDLVRDGRFEEIERLAREAVELAA
jgi:2-dehydro-3-deoxyphosphogluconate aldolase/(4S)-4-hydroxy-2-oxoglutarate aldolase